MDLDLDWIKGIQVKDTDIISKASKFTEQSSVSNNSTVPWLVKAINSVDLSLLFGNETPEAINKLCKIAANPLMDIKESDLAKISLLVNGTKIQCAAVCVYPLRLEDSVKALEGLGKDKEIRLASVAAGFPTGQFPLHTRLGEIYYAVAKGAQEIDVVIDRSLVLRELWSELYNELVQMRQACGSAVLKVILSVTECGSWTNVYKASVVAMLAGADFIKTSTGKEVTSMTIHEGLVMSYAIREFHKRTGKKVGLKPAGGVRTVEHAVSWMIMVQDVLGVEWLEPSLFRIGASSSSFLPNITNCLLNFI